MLKKVVFIKNAAVLTVASLVLRVLGIFFKVRLAAVIGAEGIGLYQLIFSFYVLVSAFAMSGLCTAVTRLVADELALGQKGGILHILRRCILLTLLVAGVSSAAVFFGAELFARLLGDVRAAPALRAIAFSLPFLGLISCLRGYFIARRNALPTAVSQVFEQLIRITLVFSVIKRLQGKDLSVVCGAVLAVDAVAAGLSTLMLFLSYRKDRKRLPESGGRVRPPYAVVRRILHIAVPITAGRYLTGTLRTVENLLVPRRLRFHTTGKTALAQFGMIKGMALPILFFPSALLNALSTLLIPEISEAAARGHKIVLRETARKVLRITALISFVFATVFFTVGQSVGRVLYHSDAVGQLLKALSPIVPLMYLDSVSDGILKGLDQQKWSFRVALCDSALRLILIIPVLPRFGLSGFIGIMYLSNLLTCALNVGRVIKLCGIRPAWLKTVLIPVTAALCVSFFTQAVFKTVVLPEMALLAVGCGVCIALYGGLLLLSGSFSPHELRDWVKR